MRVRYTVVEIFTCNAPQYVLEGLVPPDEPYLIYEYPLLCEGLNGHPGYWCCDCKFFGGFVIEKAEEEILKNLEDTNEIQKGDYKE